MRIFPALALLLLSITTGTKAAASASLSGPTTVVDLGYAQYEGSLNNQTGTIEFLGVRYAASPTGSSRWHEPQPPLTTPGVQKADTFPHTCFQAGSGRAPKAPFSLNRRQSQSAPTASEDCLFLDVSTPASSTGGLPVVVWIHGGGYQAGSASSSDGDDLIRQAGGGVVVVLIQYRLGVLGFLPGKQVHDGGSLNVGLLDQQFALQWVQSHISKFGGDPKKVTIWGESAGAGSVLQHVIANNGDTRPPLFRAAITSSTFLPSQYKFDDQIPEQIFSMVVNQTGCSKSSNALDCLRHVDINLLQQVNVNISSSAFFGTFIFVPVVDGEFITKRPTELLRDGKVNGEALLAVTNTFEGRVFVDLTTASTVNTPTYLANLFPDFRDDDISNAAALYKNLGAPIDQAVAIMGESIFICPTYYLLRAFNNTGFKGEFAIPPGNHGMDVIFYFPNGQTPPFNNTLFINNFSQSFLNFALSLDPNVKWDPQNTVPQWAKWNDHTHTEMLFNKTSQNLPEFGPISTDAALLQRCSFWESVAEFSGQ